MCLKLYIILMGTSSVITYFLLLILYLFYALEMMLDKKQIGEIFFFSFILFYLEVFITVQQNYTEETMDVMGVGSISLL